MQNAQLESSTPFLVSKSHVPRERSTGTSDRLILWRLRRATDDLVCATVFTSYGHALAVELAGELILFELVTDPERLVRKADRLEAWLLTHGWRSTNKH